MRTVVLKAMAHNTVNGSCKHKVGARYRNQPIAEVSEIRRHGNKYWIVTLASRPGTWTKELDDRLRSLWPKYTARQIAAMIGRTPTATKARAANLHLRKLRPWTVDETALVRKLYPNSLTKVIAKRLKRNIWTIFSLAARLGLKKTAAFMAAKRAAEKERLLRSGAAHRFKPGQIPANKGLRRPGYSIGRGRMRETQFKKGQRNGIAAQRWKPIGSTRINADGYLDRKVKDTGYPPVDWVGEHIVLWRKAHGRIRPGRVIVFKDGNKSNVVLENLECISRKELMRRNTIHNLPPELKQVLLLTGALKRKINNRKEKLDAKQKSVGLARPSV